MRKRAITGLSVLFALFIGFPSGAFATPFDFEFGFSPEIVVVANHDVLIAAALINRGTSALNFGCALPICGGLDFTAIVTAAAGEGLNALNLTFEPTFFSQFAGVSLDPGHRFDFLFARVNFNPLDPVGNPLGTVLHPTFSLRIGSQAALIQSTISVGSATAFSPLVFSVPVPEPSSVLLIAFGLAGLICRFHFIR
jgi:hypothetical protein